MQSQTHKFHCRSRFSSVMQMSNMHNHCSLFLFTSLSLFTNFSIRIRILQFKSFCFERTFQITKKKNIFLVTQAITIGFHSLTEIDGFTCNPEDFTILTLELFCHLHLHRKLSADTFEKSQLMSRHKKIPRHNCSNLQRI